MTTARAPSLILASASPRRQEILQRIGLKFRVEPSPILEPERRFKELPREYAVRVARAKAQIVARHHKSGLVIGADTLVFLRNRHYGKPIDKVHARAMLQSLNDKWHEVVTGLCLIDCSSRRACSSSTTSRVHFRRLSAREIEAYLETGEYRGKAGAYAIQGYASLFIDRIEGCYFNIVGFPVSAFERLCRRISIDLWDRIKYGDSVACHRILSSMFKVQC